MSSISHAAATTIRFDHALLPDGWARDVRVRIAGATIAAIEPDAAPAPDDVRHAIGVPGMSNLHSHAFQYAMAGLAERAGSGGNDSFWTWRALMYDQVARLTPDDLRAIAAMAQVEMLESGFTRVGEFHYLHHRPDGGRYDAPAEMAAAVADAARTTGIALTLLPVFYAHAGFGGRAPEAGQRRFVTDLDGFATLLDDCARSLRGLDGAVLGVAPHSLRAVTAAELGAVAALRPGAPVHIHVAEQVREVEDCVAWSGQRPIAYLLDHADVDARWCLVHATHADPAELIGMAARDAVVGLCPITEANLGDGLFPAPAWRDLGGAFGIGSDSNVRIDASEELRLLEYGQRLRHRGRNVLAADGGSTGGWLFGAALRGGAQALGASSGGLAVGETADLVALKPDHACIAGDTLLDRWIFARGGAAIEGVWRGGRQVVAAGRHVARDPIAASYSRTIARLLA